MDCLPSCFAWSTQIPHNLAAYHASDAESRPERVFCDSGESRSGAMPLSWALVSSEESRELALLEHANLTYTDRTDDGQEPGTLDLRSLVRPILFV